MRGILMALAVFSAAGLVYAQAVVRWQRVLTRLALDQVPCLPTGYSPSGGQGGNRFRWKVFP